MTIYVTGAHKPLLKKAESIKESKRRAAWRCIVCKIDKDLYQDPYARQIAESFLEKRYAPDVFMDLEIYWLRTGHMFVLFEGMMKRVVEIFEEFLDFISEGEELARPQFCLYQLGKDWGWFVDWLEEAMAEIEGRTENKDEEGEAENYDDDSRAQKQLERMADDWEAIPKQDLTLNRKRRMKPTLLLVEDELMTQAFLSSLLENYCEMIVANTVAEGRRKYLSHWPDIVFMDIMLPDGDGEGLMKEIVTHDSDAHVIMVSGADDKKRIDSCLNAGARSFIEKPVTRRRDALMQQIFAYNQKKRMA